MLYTLVQPETISPSAVIFIWSTAEVQEDSIKFTYADNEYVITPEVVRQALKLPEVTSYAPSYPDDEIKILSNHWDIMVIPQNLVNWLGQS